MAVLIPFSFLEGPLPASAKARSIRPDQEIVMAETFRLQVERYTEEFLKQVKPGTGTVNLYLRTNHNEEEEMAAGEAAVEVAEMLQRSITLHFTDGEQQGE